MDFFLYSMVFLGGALAGFMFAGFLFAGYRFLTFDANGRTLNWDLP